MIGKEHRNWSYNASISKWRLVALVKGTLSKTNTKQRTFLDKFRPRNALLNLLLIVQVRLTRERFMQSISEIIVPEGIRPAKVEELCISVRCQHLDCRAIESLGRNIFTFVDIDYLPAQCWVCHGVSIKRTLSPG